MKTTILTGIVLLCPVAIWGADGFDIKPGLWETTTTMSTEIAGRAARPMPQLTEEQLAQVPPAQRAQLEAMMKGRGMGGGQPIVTKICQTKESIASGQSFSRQGNDSCTSKIISMTATRVETHMECRGELKGSGDLIVERIDAEHAKGNLSMKMEGDHPATTKMSFTTKWLSADCGDVKPIVRK